MHVFHQLFSISQVASVHSAVQLSIKSRPCARGWGAGVIKHGPFVLEFVVEWWTQKHNNLCPAERCSPSTREAGRDAPGLGRSRARREEAKEGGWVARGLLSVKAQRKENGRSVWGALGGHGGQQETELELSPADRPKRHAQSSGPHPDGPVQPGEDLEPGRPRSTGECRALSVVASRKAALGPGAVNCRRGGRLEHSIFLTGDEKGQSPVVVAGMGRGWCF